MSILTKIQNIVHNGPYGNNLMQAPDYSNPESLANASVEDLEGMLESFDVQDDYAGYFVEFNPQDIADIEANLQNKLGQLSIQNQQKLKNMRSQLKTASQGYKETVSKRGFEGSGDLTAKFKEQQQTLFGGITGLKQSDVLTQESLALSAEKEKRSAYEDYLSKFYQQLGTIQQMGGVDEED